MDGSGRTKMINEKKEQIGGRTMSYWYSHVPGNMLSSELTNIR